MQAIDGWRNIHTIESLTQGMNLTPTGKAIMIVFGWGGLFVTIGVLSVINWRSHDFNLKGHSRQIRLLNPPQGKSAVASTTQTPAPTVATPATNEG